VSQHRIVWIDYAKGIAILFVFLMHSAFPTGATAYISAFCMMLFFFLSGFVFSIRKFLSFKSFLWNKIRTLVIPGLVLSIVPFLIQIPFQNGVHSLSWYVRYFAGFCINLRGREGFGQIPWFLTCLFVIELGSYFLVRYADRVRSRLQLYSIAAVIVLIAGYTYSVLVHVALPWSLDIAIIMSFYFILGLIARKRMDVVKCLLNKRYLPITALMLFVGTYINGRIFAIRINPYMNQYGNFICLLVASMGGIWFVLIFCRTLELYCRPNAFLTYCGKNTLVFYCINQAIESYFPDVLKLVGLDAASPYIWVQMACGVITVIINLIVCSLCASMINRFLPALLGK